MRKIVMMVLLAFAFTQEAFAQELRNAATLYYGPETAAVPGLNGLMITILALLIFAVTFLVAKRKGAGAMLSTAAAVLVSGLFAGAGGLTSDAYATTTNVDLTQPGGGSVPLKIANNVVENQSGVAQIIQNIEVAPFCWVDSGGDCTVGLRLEQGESCSIYMSCT